MLNENVILLVCLQMNSILTMLFDMLEPNDISCSESVAIQLENK